MRASRRRQSARGARTLPAPSARHCHQEVDEATEAGAVINLIVQVEGASSQRSVRIPCPEFSPVI
jgi:hypothetical protein